MNISLQNGDHAFVSFHNVDKDEINKLFPGAEWKDMIMNEHTKTATTTVMVGGNQIDFYAKREDF